MNIDLHIPRRGDRVSAAYMARILAEIRANRILPSPGIRVARGPHGTHISVDVPKRAPAPAADKGCWRIVAESIEVETGGETATSTVHYIDRQYFQVGGTLVKGNDKTTLESFVESGKGFIAAKVVYDGSYSVSLQGYVDFATMQADSLVRNYSVIPLYELKLPVPSGDNGQEGSGEENNEPTQVVVVTDFRAIPVAQAFEMPYTPPPPEEEEEP